MFCKLAPTLGEAKALLSYRTARREILCPCWSLPTPWTRGRAFIRAILKLVMGN